MRCDWVKMKRAEGLDGDCYRCRKCGTGLINVGDEPIKSVFARMPDCGERTRRREAMFRDRGKQTPGAGARVKSYTKAMLRWIKAGRPVRSDIEVARIFDTICRPCEHFDEGRGSCTVCGCKVSRSGSALRNKLAMMTENCPKGKGW